VSWNFETKGLITIKCGHMEKGEKYGDDDRFVAEDRDDVMIKIMDIEGILDIEEEGSDELSIFTEFKNMTKVRDSIAKMGYILKDASIIKIAKIEKKLEGEAYEKVIQAIDKLEDYNDVQNIWTDLVIK